MKNEAVTYYRQHRRTVEALIASGSFPKRHSASNVNLNDFLKNSEELRAIEKRTEAFNLFVALGVAEVEIRHSRLLAWLLNPSGSHGAGIAYIKSFLELVCEEDGDNLADYGLDLKDIEILVESDQMDLLLIHKLGRFVCVIENKVRIDQGDRQLEIYRRKIEATYRDWTCKFVFLTLKGEKPADAAFIPIPYECVLQTVIGQFTPPVPDREAEAKSLLFESYAEILRNDGKGLSPSNIMQILHLTRHELKHSHFLAWLLDPVGTHGLKDDFARFLLGLLERKGLKLPKPLAALTLSDAVVRAEREDIDILLVSERHRLVLAIENKFGATESAGQLAKYHEFLQRHYAGDHFVHVFLDMQGRNPTHKSYQPVSYGELLPFFESKLAGASKTGDAERRVQIYVQHYAALLTDQLWIKRKTKWYLPANLQECCERLALRHGDYTCALIHEVTSWQKELGRGLEGFLYEVADRCFGKVFRFSWDIWFTFIPPELDEIPILREGGADPELPGRMVMYQSVSYTHLTLPTKRIV